MENIRELKRKRKKRKGKKQEKTERIMLSSVDVWYEPQVNWGDYAN
jgi:hypothetical protein